MKNKSNVLCYNKYKGGYVSVTICVTAICSDGHIIYGASDRMLTAGDIQFEPQQSKIWSITNSIIIQVAGDASIHSDIIKKVNADVGKRIQENPADWWNIKDVAELYRHYYEELQGKRAEHDILAPLLLDQDTWFTKQKDMDAELVKDIAARLSSYELSPTAAIISGVDYTGAHIYVADGGILRCQDNVGFAAIGAGQWHANSHLMFAGHNPHKEIPETLWNVFSAKKRAQIAPGCGQGTDMFTIGPLLGSYAVISPDILGDLEKIYQEEQGRQRKATENAKRAVKEYIDGLAKQVAKTQEAKATETPTAKRIDAA
jgi:hypothetical protein